MEFSVTEAGIDGGFRVGGSGESAGEETVGVVVAVGGGGGGGSLLDLAYTAEFW